jgi:hypothetical protein
MSEDLGPFLKRWAYDPERTIRMIRGQDGRRKVQVRLLLGIEQYDLDGRPDGMRPYGCPSALAYWERRLRTYVRRRGSDAGFVIPPAACARLREESLLYYYRYVILFQVGEYGRSARDTARNLRCIDLVGRFAGTGEDREAMEQYRPYIVRMHRASRALLAMRRQQYDIALREIEAGLRVLESLPPREWPAYRFERKRSLVFLRRLRREVRRHRPLSPRERLERELRQAVQAEDYERAARLRDLLSAMAKGGAG